MKKIILIAAACSLATGASAQTIVGLTETDSLFTFQAGSPGAISGKVAVSGLGAGQRLAGMDYRPATGELFAMGYNSNTNAAQLYTVNATTGALTTVGSGFSIPLGTGSIGFDFNPTVDRIRLVGANRSNYRLNPTTGAVQIQDGMLTYAVGDPRFLSTPSIGAAAYTNSFPVLTATTLYYYDEALNSLVSSSDPNAGTLNTVGNSGITINPSAPSTDLDISFNPSTRQNTAYFVANTSGMLNDNLYTVNLASGAMTQVGAIGLAVKDIAVQPVALTTTPTTGNMIYALSGARSLVSFAANAPRQIRSAIPITGVDSAYSIVGMDFRPATGELFALGYIPTNSVYRLYNINMSTGAATALNSGATDTLSLGNTTAVGFDFNPTVDRIRVVSALSRANYRLNPTNGAIAAMDSSLSWTAGDPNANLAVRVSTVAYTNSYPNATSTAMSGINDSGRVFLTAPAPNSGRISTMVSDVFGMNMALYGNVDFDYFYDSVSSTNIGYVAANTATAGQDVLYTLVPATGALTAVDTIGYGFPVSNIAVMPRFRNAAPPNSVAAVSGVSALLVYPNPAAAAIQVVLPAAGVNATGWMITDLAGRTLLQGRIPAGTRTAEVPLSGLATGLYLMAVEGQAPLRFSKL